MASTPSSFTTSSTTTPPLRASAATSQMDPNAIPSPGGGGAHPYYNLPGSHSTPAHLHSPPSSVAHSPSSVNESPTSYHHPPHQHAYYQQPSRTYSYSHMPQKEHSLYPLPPDSFPRTISKGAFDQDRLLHQLPSPSIPSSYSRPHYQLHQSSYPPTSSSRLHSRTHSYEDLPPSNSGNGSGRGNGGISSGLPEYSYPMGPPPRLNRSLHLPPQHRLPHECPPPAFHRHRQDGSDTGNPQERQYILQPPEQTQSQRAPLSIHTSRSPSDVLPLRSGPGLSINTRPTDSQLSSATPRSLPMSAMSASIRQSFTDLCAYTESPVDERDFNGHRHTIPGAARSKYDHGNYDMEQYSELEGFHPSESEDEHDEDDTHAKRQKLGNGGSRPLPYHTTVPFSRSEADIPIERQNININAIGEEYREEGGCHLETTIGVSGNSPSDERPQRRGRKPKNAAQKRGSRRTSLPMSPSDPNDQTEGDATGPQSLSGKGLRIYAQRVCDRVKAKGSTSYNELVHDLFGGNAGDDEDNVPEAAKQENIRRRVYDALNVLHAIDIIKFENKDICWVGAERSAEVRSVTESQIAMARAQDPPEDGDEESEEPEYDDMDIEELQREVDAMKVRNELEQAKLQDQITRQVQVMNLVKRNKQREEREARRKQLKEERRRATATDQDASMTDVGPQGASDHNDETRRKSDRRRRRQSRRQPGENGMVDVEEDEETRRRRKQERKERRERKERQRNERIQLPFVIVRMPGYTGQSSDSESSISVVRRVKSGKGRKSNKSSNSSDSTSQETTMVEIQVPQQDELGFMSDTEILGDLGFNTVTMDDLETMLPKELVEAVKYTVNGDEANHTHSLRSQRRAQSGDSVPSAEDDMVSTEEDASSNTSITVRGGFEREIVRAASESASSTA